MSSEQINTKTRILKASWKLLESQSGKQVRMSDIARLAGISRQALYLHFKTRTDLLIATTQYIDEIKGVDKRLEASRSAQTGIDRLEAFIEAWGNYIPEIYGVAKALMAVRDTDDAAATAWDGRMQAVREGCEAAIRTLKADSQLTPEFSDDQATDILWSLLSVRNWELFTHVCGWDQALYIQNMKKQARAVLVP